MTTVMNLPTKILRKLKPALHKYIKANNLNIETNQKKCICDSGADTNVIGQGWTIVTETTRTANIIGFDTKIVEKKNLPIVTGVAAMDVDKDTTIIIRAHESVYNKDAQHTLLSDFQTRECVHRFCTVWKGHRGKQTLELTEDAKIPLRMLECMMTFKV